MKKKLLMLGLVIFSACSNNLETNIQEPKNPKGEKIQSATQNSGKLSLEDIDSELIGDIHNKALDFIYNNLKSKDNCDFLINGDLPIIKRNLKNNTMKFMENEFEKDELYQKTINNFLSNCVYDPEDDSFKNELPRLSLKYYNLIENLFDNEELTTENIINKLNLYQGMAKFERGITETDLNIIQGMISISKSSLLYWEKNYIKWTLLIERDYLIKPKGFFGRLWRKIGKADMTGFVSVGVSSGIITGNGVVGLAGGLIGAIYYSTHAGSDPSNHL